MPGKTGVSVIVKTNRLPAITDAIKPAVVDVVKTTTLEIEAESKRLVPVKTGLLRRSIHSLFEAGGLRGRVGPSVDYDKFVEFGTRHHGARPYMRPAAERSAPRFIAGLTKALGSLK
jgi:HK97 gp10 family phage protein